MPKGTAALSATRAEARRAIMKWVNWYDTRRIHNLGGVSPIEWEQTYNHPPAEKAA